MSVQHMRPTVYARAIHAVRSAPQTAPCCPPGCCDSK